MNPDTVEKTFDELRGLFELRDREREPEWHETLLRTLGASDPITNSAGSTYRLFSYNDMNWVYSTNPMNDGFEINPAGS